MQVAPRTGIVRGQSAVVGLRSGEPNDVIVKADAAQVVALEAAREGYPGSLMGAIAVIRQAFMDAKWYRDALAVYQRAPQGKERPEVNLSWAALEPVIAGRQPALFVADEMLEVLRSAALAREAGVTAQVVGAGDEYKRVREIAAAGAHVVVPGAAASPVGPGFERFHDHVQAGLLQHRDDERDFILPLARYKNDFFAFVTGLL